MSIAPNTARPPAGNAPQGAGTTPANTRAVPASPSELERQQNQQRSGNAIVIPDTEVDPRQIDVVKKVQATQLRGLTQNDWGRLTTFATLATGIGVAVGAAALLATGGAILGPVIAGPLGLITPGISAALGLLVSGKIQSWGLNLARQSFDKRVITPLQVAKRDIKEPEQIHELFTQSTMAEFMFLADSVSGVDRRRVFEELAKIDELFSNQRYGHKAVTDEHHDKMFQDYAERHNKAMIIMDNLIEYIRNRGFQSEPKPKDEATRLGKFQEWLSEKPLFKQAMDKDHTVGKVCHKTGAVIAYPFKKFAQAWGSAERVPYVGGVFRLVGWPVDMGKAVLRTVGVLESDGRRTRSLLNPFAYRTSAHFVNIPNRDDEIWDVAVDAKAIGSGWIQAFRWKEMYYATASEDQRMNYFYRIIGEIDQLNTQTIKGVDKDRTVPGFTVKAIKMMSPLNHYYALAMEFLNMDKTQMTSFQRGLRLCMSAGILVLPCLGFYAAAGGPMTAVWASQTAAVASAGSAVSSTLSWVGGVGGAALGKLSFIGSAANYVWGLGGGSLAARLMVITGILGASYAGFRAARAASYRKVNKQFDEKRINASNVSLDDTQE